MDSPTAQVDAGSQQVLLDVCPARYALLTDSPCPNMAAGFGPLLQAHRGPDSADGTNTLAFCSSSL